MESLSNTVNMTIRIDKDLKKDIDILFKNLGINTSSAIMMFLKQCNREQGLPFTPNMLAPAPSKELLESLEEAKEISKDSKRKGYKNIEEVMKALNE